MPARVTRVTLDCSDTDVLVAMQQAQIAWNLAALSAALNRGDQLELATRTSGSDLELRTQLLGERAHNAHAKSPRLVHVEFRRQPDALVTQVRTRCVSSCLKRANSILPLRSPGYAYFAALVISSMATSPRGTARSVATRMP